VRRGRTWPGGHGPSPGGLRPSTSARVCPGAPPPPRRRRRASFGRHQRATATSSAQFATGTSSENSTKSRGLTALS
jgi:hypothetical protein